MNILTQQARQNQIARENQLQEIMSQPLVTRDQLSRFVDYGFPFLVVSLIVLAAIKLAR